jgi:multidrug efflux pump subunit AcrA (membrane-fusion protein)
MTTFNVMAGGRSQVLVDEQQLQQWQAELNRRGLELDRLKVAMETLSAVNTPAHFMAAAMTLCNEMASRWHAERVGIGFLRGRYVRLVALSHTEKITRHMQLVQDIEAAMEECLDQDVEILYPPPKEASFVYRNTDALAAKQGPNAVISLPLRRPRQNLKEQHGEQFGNVVAVLTVERKADKPFTLQEIESLRLTCDLLTARLVDMYENDRWIGVKALRATRRVLAWALKPQHTWAKAAAIAVGAFIAFSVLVDGTFHVEAPFVIEAVTKQTISVPFDARLEKVYVDVNDPVMSPQTAATVDGLNALSPLVPILPVERPRSILAKLDTMDLEFQLANAKAQVAASRTEAANYRQQLGKSGEASSADLQADAAQANVDLYEWQIKHATITSPIDGRIFSGDLKGKEGTQLRKGDTLFEIGKDQVRAELSVPEDQITEVKIGQKGVLKASSYPGRPVHFTVDTIYPMATVVSGKNIFKVRITLDAKEAAGFMPGIEGLAKVDVTHAKYAWIWTHRMINWVRMKLWM